jgi:hypothetical protein
MDKTLSPVPSAASMTTSAIASVIIALIIIMIAIMIIIAIFSPTLSILTLVSIIVNITLALIIVFLTGYLIYSIKRKHVIHSTISPESKTPEYLISQKAEKALTSMIPEFRDIVRSYIAASQVLIKSATIVQRIESAERTIVYPYGNERNFRQSNLMEALGKLQLLNTLEGETFLIKGSPDKFRHVFCVQSDKYRGTGFSNAIITSIQGSLEDILKLIPSKHRTVEELKSYPGMYLIDAREAELSNIEYIIYTSIENISYEALVRGYYVAQQYAFSIRGIKILQIQIPNVENRIKQDIVIYSLSYSILKFSPEGTSYYIISSNSYSNIKKFIISFILFSLIAGGSPNVLIYHEKKLKRA